MITRYMIRDHLMSVQKQNDSSQLTHQIKTKSYRDIQTLKQRQLIVF